MDNLVNKAIEQYRQWMIGATKPRSLVLPKATFKEHPERNYNLKNKGSRHYLQH